MNDNMKRKLGSRKFWACVTAVVLSIFAFTNATPETADRIVAFMGAIGGLCVYMLSEGMADSKPDGTYIHEENNEPRE